MVRYKARLVAKGYTQIPGRDYDLTYSPVMDAITYHYMIAFALTHKLMMHLMDVVTAYLYGILDTEIFMKAPLELIKRVTFHIQGEKTRSLPLDLQSGIRQIIPTRDFTGQVSHSGPLVPLQNTIKHTIKAKDRSTTNLDTQPKA